MTPKGTECSDRLTVWVWLVMPLALAVLLVAVPRISTAFYMTWIDDERTGVLQALHWVIPLWGFIVAGRILLICRKVTGPFFKIWVVTIALGCLIIAGEEMSWGQHYFGWASPEGWTAINTQAETNVHNVSSWFNQKPRLLLELGIVVGGILIPILGMYRPKIYSWHFAIILPPRICFPTAVFVELSRVAEFLQDYIGFGFYVFYRPSEAQETYIYIFILLYLIVLHRRLIALPAAHRVGSGV